MACKTQADCKVRQTAKHSFKQFLSYNDMCQLLAQVGPGCLLTYFTMF